MRSLLLLTNAGALSARCNGVGDLATDDVVVFPNLTNEFWTALRFTEIRGWEVDRGHVIDQAVNRRWLSIGVATIQVREGARLVHHGCAALLSDGTSG